ncbi:MAG: NUDIX domain-containing protein [Thermoplasmata archaeon]
MLRMRAKSWLEKDGAFVVGEGRARLLRLVEETGSISEAARRMRMSYRHAWGILKDISKAIGESVVESRRGGKGGGETRLSEIGKEVLSAYEQGNSSIQTFLEGGPRHPRIAVDGLLTYRGRLVAVRRKYPPFQGELALPGGFVEYGEKVEEAVMREFEEETGITTKVDRILGVYSDPGRDPRGHVISVVFLLERRGGRLKSGSDARCVELIEPEKTADMAFDHARIVRDYLRFTDRC